MLSIGQQLSHYEIVSAIGCGGMGEVYKARDTRLNRVVALKVLLQDVSSSPELRQRFQREAQTVAALNHPHICVLHDVGQEDGRDYLVMEFLEGETLASRLERGPLPLAEAFRVGCEIADALDKAHRQGIVHRDIKPSNIMLTKSGAKLLDFGLAKLKTEQPGFHGTASAVTRADATAEGTIIGTLQYMSPEQLEGGDAGARTDIFAFGSVLYEMITGRKAFEGKSKVSLIAAIIEHQPPPILSTLPLSSPSLDRLIRVCLEKDPEHRWQTAHDLLLELRWVSEQGAAPPTSLPIRRRLMEWLAAAAVGIGVAGLVWAFNRPDSTLTSQRAVQFSISAPRDSTLHPTPPAVSPDGSQIAFVALNAAGRDVLWVRPLDAPSAEALPGTDGAAHPFWSPDGRAIGFFSSGMLKRVTVSGRAVTAICEVADARGGTWNKAGEVVFAGPGPGELFRVSAAGGVPQAIAVGDSALLYRFPQFLPDGVHVLTLAYDPQKETNRAVYLVSLESQTATRLFEADSTAWYAPPGYLIFTRGAAVFARPFDPDALTIAGEPIPLDKSVIATGEVYGRSLSVAENGVFVFQPAGDVQFRTAWFDRTGKLVGEIERLAAPAISPDARSVAGHQSGDVWIYEPERQTKVRLTFDPASDMDPVWAPDGTRILFASRREGMFNLYVTQPGGTGKDELIVKSPNFKYAMDWSRDGRYIVYEEYGPTTNWDLWYAPVAGDRKPVQFLATPYAESQPQLSPDGRWFSYTSNESGSTEIYVQPFPNSGKKTLISTKGGLQSRWRSDGNELFYLSPTGSMMAVDVSADEAGFRASVPRELFQTTINRPSNALHTYAVSKDGQRFLLFSAREVAPSSLSVVLNWPALLTR